MSRTTPGPPPPDSTPVRTLGANITAGVTSLYARPPVVPVVVGTPGRRRTWVVAVICRSVGVVVVMWGAGGGILRCGFAGAVAAALSLPASMR